MKNLRPFQIVMLASFTVLAVVSIVALAGFEAVSFKKVNPYGDQVVIWGTFDAVAVSQSLSAYTSGNRDFNVVSYRELSEATFEDELVNAIAEGRAPDVVFITDRDLVTLRPKLQPIPYETFPLRTIKDTYIDGAEIFARNDGMYAVPVGIDPLVMYWNRDIFSSNGLPNPPRTWQELTTLVVPTLTIRDDRRDIIRAAVAFGEYQNVVNGKAVILSLLMQSGSRLVEELESRYNVALNDPVVADDRKPMAAALEFYSDFSNPNSVMHTWDRSFQDDRTAFVAEDLALYFGYGSEADRIRSLNPNFNFDATSIPQGAGVTIKRSYGTVHGLALVRASDNKNGAFEAIKTIALSENALQLSEALLIAPAQRTLLEQGSLDPVRQVMFTAALVARGWLDPKADTSSDIFRQMVDDIVSGRIKVTAAVEDAVNRLKLAF